MRPLEKSWPYRVSDLIGGQWLRSGHSPEGGQGKFSNTLLYRCHLVDVSLCAIIRQISALLIPIDWMSLLKNNKTLIIVSDKGAFP